MPITIRPAPTLTVENTEKMQRLYFDSFLLENKLMGDLRDWLKVHKKHRKVSRKTIEEFITDWDLKDLFRKWLILTFREDNGDDVTTDDINKFVQLFEIK